MLKEKELAVYKTIKEFIKNNNYSPTVRELCDILNYKSTRTIHRYLQILKENNYIKYTKNKKRSISINQIINKNLIAINTNEIINFNIDTNKIIYKITNDYFNEYFIRKNDYLIINEQSRLNENELGLFFINNKYRVMKYSYKNGFYILKDKETEILYKINIIGKVVGIYRKKL